MKNNLIEITNGRIRSEKNLGIGLATMSTPTCKDNKDMQSLSVPQLSEYSEPKLKTPVDVRCIKKNCCYYNHYQIIAVLLLVKKLGKT